MGVFTVRALFSGDNFSCLVPWDGFSPGSCTQLGVSKCDCSNAIPYFSDVPQTHPFYKVDSEAPATEHDPGDHGDDVHARRHHQQDQYGHLRQPRKAVAALLSGEPPDAWVFRIPQRQLHELLCRGVFSLKSAPFSRSVRSLPATNWPEDARCRSGCRHPRSIRLRGVALAPPAKSRRTASICNEKAKRT